MAEPTKPITETERALFESSGIEYYPDAVGIEPTPPEQDDTPAVMKPPAPDYSKDRFPGAGEPPSADSLDKGMYPDGYTPPPTGAGTVIKTSGDDKYIVKLQAKDKAPGEVGQQKLLSAAEVRKLGLDIPESISPTATAYTPEKAEAAKVEAKEAAKALIVPGIVTQEDADTAFYEVGDILTATTSVKIGINSDNKITIRSAKEIAELAVLQRTFHALFAILYFDGPVAFNAAVALENEKNQGKLAKFQEGIIQLKGVDIPEGSIIPESFETRQAVIREKKIEKQIAKDYIKTPDDQYILKTEFNRIQSSDAELANILQTQGVEAANAFIDKQNAEIAAFNAEAEKHNAMVARSDAALSKLQAAGVVDEKQNVDGAAYLRQNPKDIFTLTTAGFSGEDVKKWQNFNNANILPVFQSEVKEKRAELLKSIKPMLGENPDEFYLRVDGQSRAEVLKNYSPEMVEAIQKRQLVDIEGYIVPYMHTGANWAYMSTGEKVLSIGIETAAIMAMLYGPRIIKGAVRQIKVPKAEKLAREAGIAALKLEKANATVSKVTADLPKDPVAARLRLTAATDGAETAQRASLKADRLFLQELEKLGVVSNKDLIKLEKAAGIKNIASSISDIKKATSRLDKAWTQLEKAQQKIKQQPPAYRRDGYSRAVSDWLESQRVYQKAVENVQGAQANLEKALLAADSTLQVRFKYPDAPDPFKGYRVNTKKIQLKGLENVQKQIDMFNASKNPPKGGGTKPQTIVRTRIQIQESEAAASKKLLSPEYGKPQIAKPQTFKAPKVATKKITSPKVIADPLTKKITKAEPSTKQDGKTERIWTTKQREKIASDTFTENGVMTDAVAGVYYKQLEKLINVNNYEFSNEQYQKVLVNIKNAFKDKLQPATATKLKDLTKTDAVEKLAIKAIIKLKTKTILEKPILEKPLDLLKLKPKIPMPLLDADKKLRKKATAAVKKGSMAWYQGKIKKNGKIVELWYVGKYPYLDAKYWDISYGRPKGATVVNGRMTAYNTIQQLTGVAPNYLINFDLGIQDGTLNRPSRKPGKKGAIKYKRDLKQKTKGDIQLKGVR